MRTLYLIRHAKSSWGNPGLRDFDRPLNERGMHDAPRMAQLLVREGVAPDLILSSPAKRALSTAHFFAKAFDIPETEVAKNQDIYEAHPREILRIISELPPHAETVLLFGHNPTFTDVANLFIKDDPVENVPTCGIVKIESEADSWRAFYEGNSKVTQFLFPKEVL